jgi:hypothetical protein
MRIIRGLSFTLFAWGLPIAALADVSNTVTDPALWDRLQEARAKLGEMRR